jgi:uncharacterized protein YndB with AHSA1/START domain
MRYIRNTAILAIVIIVAIGAYGLLTPSITHSFSVSVDRPVITVFATLADARQMPKWVRSLEKVEPIGRPLFPGMPTSSYDLHYSKALLGTTYRLDILSVEPLSSISTRLHNRESSLTADVSLHGEAGSTRLEVTMTAQGGSPITRMFLPLAKWKVVSESEENFHRFKQVLESE